MARGQAEIVIILGIVAVAAVVIIYAVQSGILGSDVPAGIKAKYDSVKASFEGLVRDGVQDTIGRLSLNGGYLDNSSYPMGSVAFLGKEVPYWQNGGQVRYPNVQENFRLGLRDYLSRNKEPMLQAARMSGVELGEPQVAASFLANKIIISVNMPTTIDGTKVSKPYNVEVQTRLGEIEEFSKAFAQYDANQRPLEYYTISSMVLSPIEEDVHAVPTFIYLTQCGEYVFKSWWDVKPEMEKVIRCTLPNVYMPGKAPEDYMMSSSCPKYTLVPLNGKRYESLEVDFFAPDGFELTQADFQFTPDPITATSNMIPMVGACQSDPVYVKYYLSYPAVVRVKDPETQNVFQFAVDVYIKDNLPGPWSNQSGYEADVQKQICSNYQCFADVTVKDSSGRPVDSANVMFMGCNLGRTGSGGRLAAAAPCGIGPLQVYRDGYIFSPRMESSDNIAGLSVSLVKTPAVRLHFYEVIVQNLSLAGKYQIYKDGISPIGESQNVYMNFYDLAGGKLYERGFSSRASQLANMPAGNYIIGGTLYSITKSLEGAAAVTELGGIMLNYTIAESLDGKDLYVYLPSTLGYGQIADNGQKAYATLVLSSLLNRCGLGPVTDTEAKNFNGCMAGYDEV